MPRMQILSAVEVHAFGTPPILNAAQRKAVFDLPGAFQKEAEKLRDPIHQIGFWLNAGYFRNGRRCFEPEVFHARDIAYVAARLGHDAALFSPAAYPARSRQRHCKIIEGLSGFRPMDDGHEARLVEAIDRHVAAHDTPKAIFYAAVEKLTADKVVLPPYHRLQEAILSAISRLRIRQARLIEKRLSKELQAELDALLEETDDEGGDRRYPLTALKRHSQSVRPHEVKTRLANHDKLSQLYARLDPLVGALGWDQKSVRVYAQAVIKSDVRDLRRRSPADRHLHLIAFVAHQYYTLQDNLIATLLSSVKAAENTAAREHKDWCYAERKSQAAKLKARIAAFEAHFKTAMATLKQVFIAKDLTDSEKLASLELLLFPVDDTPVLSDEILRGMKEDADITGDDGAQYYKFLEGKSRRLQNRAAGVLRTLSFQAETHVNPLFAALGHFQKCGGAITKTAPVMFLDPAERAAVGSGDAFRPSLYKVLLFQRVAQAIKSGSINLSHSIKFRPLDGYMIGADRWRRERDDLLAQAGMTAFSSPTEVLKTLEAALADQFAKTNANIEAGANAHVKRMPSGHLSLKTPKQDDVDSETLSRYFPQRHFVPLTEILGTIDGATSFSESLTHLRRQYARPVQRAVLFAGVIGMGCGIGLRKMGRISGDIKEDALEHAADWHFSHENIVAANDRIVAVMDGLDLPEVYRRRSGQTHTASDGQKFEVMADSLEANRSYKYFGKGQGVSAYTFVDSRGFLWYSTVFSAAERESAYVIDGLMHNDVVKSDIHSTDTHGYSEAVFSVTHFLEIAYAPRIKSLKRQTLYAFRSMPQQDRKTWAVQPQKYIDEAVVRDHWEDILRLVVTIKLKQATASDIFRRLNSYSKQNTLYTALKAFGRIIKTLFILRYIDDVDLRMAIEAQLNQVELANRFTRAVAVGNPREFAYAHQEDQQVAEACNRLIKNAIICWNYLYLEMRLRSSDPAQRKVLLLAVKTHSPMSWAHINLLGEYDFSEAKLTDSHGILPLN